MVVKPNDIFAHLNILESHGVFVLLAYFDALNDLPLERAMSLNSEKSFHFEALHWNRTNHLPSVIFF